LAPERAADQLDQVVEPHPRPAPDVDRDGDPGLPRGGPGGPLHRGQDAVHTIGNIRIVALARSVAVHPHGLVPRDQVGEPMNGEVRALTWSVHGEEHTSDDRHTVAVSDVWHLTYVCTHDICYRRG